MSVQVQVALIAAIPSMVAAVLAYLATRQGRQNHRVAVENTQRLGKIERQTNGELNRKIREAVVEVFKDHREDVTEAVMTEAIRHLLDAMLTEGTRNGTETR